MQPVVPTEEELALDLTAPTEQVPAKSPASVFFHVKDVADLEPEDVYGV